MTSQSGNRGLARAGALIGAISTAGVLLLGAQAPTPPTPPPDPPATTQQPAPSEPPATVPPPVAATTPQPAPPAAPQEPTPAVRSTPAEPPRLVVFVTVDQMRADYVEMYGSQWSEGLKEIFTQGAYFTDAAYPYATTKTCVGHSTIGTGTLPKTHGMVDNEWFDPATREFVTCTEDPKAQSISFAGGSGTEHHSGARLLVPTFAEELKRQSPRPGRIVSMSVKARSAIGIGGHGGPNTIILWQEDAGVWSTSTGLTKAPAPEVVKYVKAHPITVARGQIWDRVMPESMYRFNDRAPGEPADAVFPHLLIEPIRTSRTSPTFDDLWIRTPAVDAYLGDLAGTLVRQLELGQHSTDVLAIGFSGLDIVGHPYGPRSHEVQDTLARLDRILGQLLTLLDQSVGRDHFVLVLSADHGAATLPEQADPTANAGRIPSVLPVGTAIEAALRTEFGPGRYVDAMAGTYLYFRPGVLKRIRSSPTAVKAVETAAAGARGIARVYWAWDLESDRPTDDPILVKFRNSHKAGRSGDLAILLRQNWIAGATGTNHGSPYDYDSRVPVAFLGSGIAPGRYASAATPVDIAPTLAALTRIKLAHTDGRILTEALASASR